MKPTLIILLFAACFPASVTGDDQIGSQADHAKYVSWVYPVAYTKGSSDRVKDLAKRLWRELGRGVPPLETNVNPVCCIWLENEKWKPNPSQDGYVIIIQPGGGTIRATDERQLELAVDHLLKLRKIKGKTVLIPVGLITNYPIVGSISTKK